MRLFITRNFAAFGMVGAVALAACSYGHGVSRVLKFDKDVSDLTCLINQLERFGYQVHNGNSVSIENRNLSYEPLTFDTSPRVSMHIGLTQYSNDDGTYETDPYTLSHNAYFGSGPVKCNIVKPVAKLLVDVEETVFAACNLIPLKAPEQKIRCG